jgi:peptidoglycan/xylan/chitin deacetylase (PgdA/CDA1 family)
LVLRGFDRLDGVVLTFDDGPHAAHTERIVSILEARGIRAMFFVLGSELEKYLALGKLLRDSGQVLGNHSYDHYKVPVFDVRSVHRSLGETERLISSCAAREYQRYVRPPYGIVTPALLAYVALYGYRLIGWTKDSRDSLITKPRDLVSFVIQTPLQKGDILLFHEDYSHTVEALPEILDSLLEKGIRFTIPASLQVEQKIC